MHFDAPRNPIKNLGLFSWGCLASVDGRDEDPYHKGLKAAWGARGFSRWCLDGVLSSDPVNHLCQVGGQPCVWCNGAVCHNNGTNRCEVYDVQVNGKGKVLCLDLGATDLDRRHATRAGTITFLKKKHSAPQIPKDHCELGSNLKPTMTVLKEKR